AAPEPVGARVLGQQRPDLGPQLIGQPPPVGGLGSLHRATLSGARRAPESLIPGYPDRFLTSSGAGSDRRDPRPRGGSGSTADPPAVPPSRAFEDPHLAHLAPAARPPA